MACLEWKQERPPSLEKQVLELLWAVRVILQLCISGKEFPQKNDQALISDEIQLEGTTIHIPVSVETEHVY